jgi:hypothetical protein
MLGMRPMGLRLRRLSRVSSLVCLARDRFKAQNPEELVWFKERKVYLLVWASLRSTQGREQTL